MTQQQNDYFMRSIEAMVEVEKQKEFAQKPIKTLGEVILLLEAQPALNIIKLDFTNQNPRGLISYRGYYSDLCLDYDSDAKPMTVKQLLQMFEEADGSIYTGYKGGDFTMSRKTLVWVAPYGDTGRMLVNIQGKPGITTIATQEDND